ncbi:MAG: DUF6162 family protein [Deltaproteobacteria bacterium]|nr:DUF6162 family protein [Deltaproteobacteria bacterium]
MRRRWFGAAAVADGGVVTHEVRSASSGEEESWVFLTAAFICLCVIYALIFQLYDGARVTTLNTALPYQVLFRDLPGAEQRTFRQMQEGVSEALRGRSASGAWPSVDALAAEGVPPFAADPLDTLGLRWSERRDGLATQYLAMPVEPRQAPAFLILVVEPEPGASEAQAVIDEEHQGLPDGRVVHITYWKRTPALLPESGLVADPALQGWSQIRVANPVQIIEERP